MTRLTLVALALATSCLGVPACRGSGPGPSTAPNVVLVNIDTLRADHLGCYGYGRDTSPFIDSLAAEGVRFADARVASSFTRESVAALFTGRLPSRSGALGWNAAPPADQATLGTLFARAGYATGFFSATTMLTDPGFTRGFQVVEHLTEKWGVSGLGPRLSQAALGFVKTAGAKPFLLYVHYLDPHGPYEPTPAHYRKMAPAPAPTPPLGLYADVRPRLPELVASGFGPGDARFEDLVARYDAEIADTDAALAELVRGMKTLGLLDRTVIVVTSDHGEEFLEHGFVEHAWTVYDEVLRVPLVFWPKAAVPHLQDGRRASAVDVLPTLLAIAGIAERPSDLDGRSLFDEGAQPIFAELAIPERSVVRTVINDRWKYVSAAKWLPPAARPAAARVEHDLRTHGGDRSFDVCGPPVHEELYDLTRDPGERENVLAAQPGRLELLRAQLGHLLAHCREQASLRDPPLPLGAVDPADPGRERLRALGYVD